MSKNFGGKFKKQKPNRNKNIKKLINYTKYFPYSCAKSHLANSSSVHIYVAFDFTLVSYTSHSSNKLSPQSNANNIVCILYYRPSGEVVKG